MTNARFSSTKPFDNGLVLCRRPSDRCWLTVDEKADLCPDHPDVRVGNKVVKLPL